MPTTDLIPAITIRDVVATRDEMVAKFTAASALFAEATAIGRTLKPLGVDAALTSLTISTAGHRIGWFGDRDNQTLREIVQDLDRRLWRVLVEKSGIKSFMDAEARQAFHDDLDKRCPPLTIDNVHATFAALQTRRAELFERGIVNLFRRRSWDHKSNAPVAFGKRMILARGCERSFAGGWMPAVMSGAADSMDDLLRVLCVLAGHPEPDHRQASAAQIRAQSWGPATPTVIVGVLGLPDPLPLFTVKGHANGNVHLTFCRPELIARLNQIVAKHHPNVLPPAT